VSGIEVIAVIKINHGICCERQRVSEIDENSSVYHLTGKLTDNILIAIDFIIMLF